MVMTDAHADQAVSLLNHYSFDLMGYSATQWVHLWQQRTIPADWIRAAVIEALHQGRYKAISVDQLLRAWQRRQEPIRHFSHDFERMICSPLGDRFAYGYQQIDNCLEASQSPASAQAASAAEPHPPNELAPRPIEPVQDQPRSQPNPFLSGRSQSSWPELSTSAAKLGTSPAPIHQFVPPAEHSEFYTKLRAVAHQAN